MPPRHNRQPSGPPSRSFAGPVGSAVRTFLFVPPPLPRRDSGVSLPRAEHVRATSASAWFLAPTPTKPSPKATIVRVLAFSLLLATPTIAATRNVPNDFPTIQACIDAAVSGVDECVVAPGTYHETINFLGKAITLRSSDGADVTTIDATGIGGSVVTCITGEGPTTILEGFSITGGTGTHVGLYFLGGGMYNRYANPTVSGCTFNQNTASAGGGMCNDFSNPTVTNCTFSSNTAYVGGGMCNTHSSSMVINSGFIGNTGHDHGGGVYNYDGSPSFSGCLLSGNMADNGGGMFNIVGSPMVTNCTFDRNISTADFGGGGMYNYSGRPLVANCTFRGNASVYDGGGIYSRHDSTADVISCSFSGNTASRGGGMFNANTSLTITGCTFTRNTAISLGGGMYNVARTPVVTNCVFWGDNPNEVDTVPTSAPSIRFSDVQGGLPVGAVDGGGNIDMDPMFLRPPDPGPDGTWDGVDDDYGDLRLQAGSPCIDAGDPGFVPQSGETDLEGHTRVLRGRVDMGAYEFGIGDHDANQRVNLDDFFAWPLCMGGPQSVPYEAECAAFDFDGDADVDLFDVAAFQRAVTHRFVVFTDAVTGFQAVNVHDVQGEIVRFDPFTNAIVWAATDTRYHAGSWPVNGNFLGGGFFSVRYGTVSGVRRAYFTETVAATICDIRINGAQMQIFATSVHVPQE